LAISFSITTRLLTAAYPILQARQSAWRAGSGFIGRHTQDYKPSLIIAGRQQSQLALFDWKRDNNIG